MRSLIVDDDPVCRKVLNAALRAYGPVDEARSGREAVDALRRSLTGGERYDLITLDIVMPDMDGHSALVAIRALEGVKGLTAGSGAKILMTTSLSDGQHVIAAYREQCSGYLTKPIALDQLFDRLRAEGLIADPA
jgi:CheY-like chemotaxis protein